jgi:hypothetical protein
MLRMEAQIRAAGVPGRCGLNTGGCGGFSYEIPAGFHAEGRRQSRFRRLGQIQFGLDSRPQRGRALHVASRQPTDPEHLRRGPKH